MLLLAACDRAREFPSRPITIFCPWSAGGGTDRCSRQIAAQLEQELGVPCNVVNATGGAGVTGHTRSAIARPDGYTLGIITVELNMLHWRGLTSISYRDFRPLVLFNKDDAALFVKADSPYQSLRDLEQAIRAKPRSLKATGTAHGGIWHVALVGWLNDTALRGEDVVWVPQGGAAPSLAELMAGGVDMVCVSIPEAASLLDAGEIRCLGVMAEQRLAGYERVPTFREEGYDWAMGGWRGVALPQGVPADHAQKIQAALMRVVTSEQFRKFMNEADFNLTVEPAAEFTATLAQLDEQFGAIMTSEAFANVRRARYGPWVFPAVLGVLLMATAAGMAATGQFRRPAEVENVDRRGVGTLAVAIGAVAFYVLAAESLGFLIAGAALLAAMLWRLGVGWKATAALTVLLTAGVYQVFAVYLRVPLPWGLVGW